MVVFILRILLIYRDREQDASGKRLQNCLRESKFKINENVYSMHLLMNYHL